MGGKTAATVVLGRIQAKLPARHPRRVMLALKLLITS